MVSINMEATGKNIARLREENGLSVKDLLQVAAGAGASDGGQSGSAGGNISRFGR